MKKDVLPKIKRSESGYRYWYVEFKIWNEFKDKYDRFQRREGFAKCETKEAAEKNGWKLIRKYRSKINKGDYSTLQGEEVSPQNLEYIRKVKQARENPGAVTKLSIVYFAAEHLKMIKVKKRTNKTYQDYQSKFRKLRVWLQMKKLNRIDIQYFTYEDAQDFMKWILEKEGIAGKTWNDYRRLYMAVWEDAKKVRKNLVNVWRDIPRLKEDIKHQLPISMNDISRLKKYLVEHDPQLWLQCEFIFYCAVRPKELRFLKIGDIDLERKKIIVRADISKNRLQEIVDIPIHFAEKLKYEYTIRDYPDSVYLFSNKGKPGRFLMGRNNMALRFRKAREALDLPGDIVAYAFKHTGAVMAIQNGASVKELQMQYRHKSLVTTDMYMKRIDGYNSDFYRNKMPAL